MKARLVSALSVALVSYCLFAVAWGASGFKAEREAGALVARMTDNIADLERRNRELRARVEWMATDPEAATLEVRELGLVERDAVRVLLPTSVPGSDVSTTGTLLAWEAAVGVRDSDLKLAGLLSGLAVFFLSVILPDGGARRRKDREEGEGSRFRFEGKPA